MRDAVKRADRLVEVGLWEAADGGYVCRSWLKWNRSTDELNQHKKRDRERKAARKVDGAPPEPPTPFRADSARNPVGLPPGSTETLDGIREDAARIPSSRASARGGAQARHFTTPHDTPLHDTSQQAARASDDDHPTEPTSNRAAVLSSITDELVAEYAAAQPHALPRKIRSDLYREVDALLGEGIHRDVVREGLIRLSKRKDARPGLLVHLVHDVLRGLPSAGMAPQQKNLAALDAARARLHAGAEDDDWPEPARPDLRIIDGQIAHGATA
jgi:hypothetical protein